MESFSFIYQYIIPFAVVISVVVFVHEFGHYLVARLCGVKILSFSIGFGPKLFGWKDKQGTQWQVALLPLGGYVKMFGDADPASTPDDEALQNMSEEDKKSTFFYKNVWQRIAIVGAGPVFNYLFAIIVLACSFAVMGKPYAPPIIGNVIEDSVAAKSGLVVGDKIVSIDGNSIKTFDDVKRTIVLNPGTPIVIDIERNNEPLSFTLTPELVMQENKLGSENKIGNIGIFPYAPPIIGEVMEDSVAVKAGLLADDKIVSINGTEMKTFDDVRHTIARNPDTPVVIDIKRNDETLSFTLTPEAIMQANEQGGEDKIGRIGIRAQDMELLKLSPIAAITTSFTEVWKISSDTITAIGQMISGSRGAEEIGGPIRIAEISGKIAQNGVWELLWFMAIISVNLGLINLFPIPLLDGGHLLFYFVEAITGKPLNEKVQKAGFAMGIMFVASLMLFATWNDLVHLKVVEKVANLFS